MTLWSRFSSFVARVRASAWTVLVLRAFAVGVALFVLAWIGRSAAANATPSSTGGDVDGGASTSFPATASLFAGEGGLPPPSPPLVATTAPSTAAPAARASPESPVYLNHASVDELRRLPGVGPKRAEAILVLRQRLGRFHRVEDLLRVKGVGRSTLKKWRPLVRLDAPPSATDGGA